MHLLHHSTSSLAPTAPVAPHPPLLHHSNSSHAPTAPQHQQSCTYCTSSPTSTYCTIATAVMHHSTSSATTSHSIATLSFVASFCIRCTAPYCTCTAPAVSHAPTALQHQQSCTYCISCVMHLAFTLSFNCGIIQYKLM